MMALDANRIFQNEESSNFNCKECILNNSASIGYLLFEAIFGVFIRVIMLPFQFLHTFFPNLCIPGDKVTLERIEDGFFDSDFQKSGKTPLPVEEFKRRLMRIDEIAAQMNIKQQIAVHLTLYSNESKGMNFSCSDELPLLLDAESLCLKKEAFDFVVAQRLSDIALNYHFYLWLYDLCVLITEIACAILFSPIVVPFIEACFSCEKTTWVEHQMQKKSDLNAISYLGKEGALTYLEDLKEKRAKRHALEQDDLPRSGFIGCLASCYFFLRPLLFTPEGELRISSSNPLSERISYIS